MSTTSYQRGAYFERRVKKYLECRNWDVYRVSGSRSPVDLIAIHHSIVQLIQCKVNGQFSPAERKELQQREWYPTVLPMLAYRKGREVILEPVGKLYPERSVKTTDAKK